MIGWALDTAIAVSLLIALVLLVRRPVAALFGARAAYALWLAPALRAVMPPLPDGLVRNPLPSVDGAADFILLSTPASTAPEVSIVPILVAVWLGGSAVFLALHLWRHHRFVRDALASGRPLVIPGIDYDVIASDCVDGPVATGLTHPLILVPADFEQRFDADQQRFALWHEQLHHRRGDIWASAGALIVTAALWFNPLAHLALGAFRRDMEAACDARLLDEAGRSAAPAYAETILRCAARPVPRSLCALTSIDELKGRLTMLNLDHGAGRRIAGMLLAGTIAFAGIVMSPTAAAVQAKEEVKEETKEVVKILEIRESHGDKDVVHRDRDHARKIRVTTACDGEKFEANSQSGADAKKEHVKFFVCGKKGESLLPALEKAASRIEQQDDIPAERKAQILNQLRAKIAELRARG